MTGLLSPVVGLLVCVGTHILLSRHASGTPRHVAVAGSVAVGFIAMGIMSAAAIRSLPANSALEAWSSAVLWLLTYLALTYTYVFGFFNLGESARRIRLLVELRAAGDAGFTLSELLAAYNAGMIVEARLQRLLASGQIVEHGGRYHIGSRLTVRVAQMLVFLKVIYLGAPTEFEVEQLRITPDTH